MLINCHSHILNFNYVPDSFFRSRAPVRERLFRRWWARRLVQGASWLFGWIPGVGYRRLHQVLDLMNRDIEDVAKALIGEMAETEPEIVMTTPLMMDLEMACAGQTPEVPYRFQLLALSRLAAQYPGRIMPFVMIDPRKKEAAKLTIDCVQNEGFLGVKLYPPLGYHPDPASPLNEPEVSHELHKLYRYCGQEGVPITAHCSRGGAYDQEFLQAREVCREYAHPSNWAGVLAKDDYQGLRLNLGHFGGDLRHHREPSAWSGEILRMMRRFPNLYADVSYHAASLRRRTRREYFAVLAGVLKDPVYGQRIVFGTDWPMTRHTWREKDYVARWVRGCGAQELLQLGLQNPRDFLFGSGGLPERYKSFLRRHCRTLPTRVVEALSPPSAPVGPGVAAPTVGL